MGLRENQPNAYDLFESDGWPLLRVLPRDDGTFYLTNLGGMADEELIKVRRKRKKEKMKNGKDEEESSIRT